MGPRLRAHAADPTAVLYYNDFDIESDQAKFEGVKALLISLQDRGVAHALGWQSTTIVVWGLRDGDPDRYAI